MATVYWITGLSGAGKTTIGKAFFEELKKKEENSIFLDGDVLREIFGNVFGYSEEERRRCAMCYSRLCQNLQKQGFNVVCCTISMFDSVREWNRDNIEQYKEIYIKVSEEVLYKRDQKGLYSGKTKEEKKEVAGISFAFEEPKNPDLILYNDGEIKPEEQVERILGYIEK